MITGKIQQTTSYGIVLPFYLYAALAFLVSCVMLFLFSDVFQFHHFNPKTLAVTHTMALGWGTMIILGASYQLVPVLIEGKLYSNTLAYLTFVLAGLGIPLLVYGFYTFNMGWPMQTGGILINLAVSMYLINLGKSLVDSKTWNVHAIIVFTSMIWLLSTTILGLLLVYNFNIKLLDQDSIRYLSIHAHIGIVGWFLQLVVGVGSRLIPMFLISKYANQKILWSIYVLINVGLSVYLLFDLFSFTGGLNVIPAGLLMVAIALFIFYCKKAYDERIRKNVDDSMKLSLLSVLMLILPLLAFILLIFVINMFSAKGSVANLYGFLIFFGWLTAIILGMTFKTLPFIVWNKVYRNQATNQSTPSPKDLFNGSVVKLSIISYLLGFALFAAGLLYVEKLMLDVGALLLVATAVLYNFNVLKIFFHKPVRP
jgi:hypothetical protein